MVEAKSNECLGNFQRLPQCGSQVLCAVGVASKTNLFFVCFALFCLVFCSSTSRTRERMGKGKKIAPILVMVICLLGKAKSREFFFLLKFKLLYI